MQRYVLRRFLQGVITILVIAILIFALARLTGNPLDLMLPDDAKPEQRAHMAQILGLDRPYYVQLYYFLSGAVRGDFGESIRYGKSATALFLERLPNSMRLILPSFGLALAVGIPLGVLSAVRRRSLLDRISTGIAVLGVAAPSFWIGLVLIYVLAVGLHLLPTSRMGGPSHYVLPVITLGIYFVAGITRLTRSSMLDVLDSDFVKLARIKGVSERAVIWRHGLRNALIPVVGFTGMYFGLSLTGAIVVETVFAWPGVGQLTYQSVLFRDYPVLQAAIILKGAFILIVNLLVDILYAYLDPRIRYS